jgi:oxalate decarboxylase/phosphoglucose isomerase-like protein (cupin superfamily)
MSSNNLNLKSFWLKTSETIDQNVLPQIGSVFLVNKENFPTLDGVTCYTLEVWEEVMRLPHWHPNASELGYVVSGEIEVIIWRSPGETAVFKLGPGMCWFIPQAALHSLNNIGGEHAKLLVGFSTDMPQDIDLPVALNGIPAPIRNVYASPHAELKNWQGTTENFLLGKFHLVPAVKNVLTASPYGFDLAKVTPLFTSKELGSVVWGVQSNWSILQNISVLRAYLKPGAARDPIWYPDAGTLYVVSEGEAEFHIIMADCKPQGFNVKLYDYIFVPAGVLHTFMNTSRKDFAVTAFFTKADPQPEVSLSVATAFFPKSIIKSALTEYGGQHHKGNPLPDLKNKTVSPYLLKIKSLK